MAKVSNETKLVIALLQKKAAIKKEALDESINDPDLPSEQRYLKLAQKRGIEWCLEALDGIVRFLEGK